MTQDTEDRLLTTPSNDRVWCAPELLSVPTVSDHEPGKNEKSHIRFLPRQSTSLNSLPITLRRKKMQRKLSSSQSTKACDVYAFAIILNEIFSVEKPYSASIPPDFDRRVVKEHLRPNVCPKLDARSNAAIKSLLAKCWNSDPMLRPGFSSIIKALVISNPTKGKNIIDSVLKSLEEFTTALSSTTKELESMTRNMETLLHRMMPGPIAKKLAAGEAVVPEYFESVTVLFRWGKFCLGFSRLISLQRVFLSATLSASPNYALFHPRWT